MKTKQQLIDYLQGKGKTHSWKELYDMFPFKQEELTGKQKSDLVRKIYKSKITIPVQTKQPKILIFDIETAPLLGYVWRLWQQNVNPVNGQLQSEWFMLTWSAKWLFEDKIMSSRLTPKEVLNQDDSRLTKEMWDLFNEADIVIAHNGISFDVRILNTRFLRNGLTPPSPYQIIDTKVHAARHLSFESNKLDYIGKILGLGRKVDTGGFELWERCMKGDGSALKEMETYNIGDVQLLEEIYLVLRPFIKPHPNLNVIVGSEEVACPSCMSKDLNWSGTYYTQVSAYQAFSCNACGSVGRSRKNITTKEFRNNSTISLSR